MPFAHPFRPFNKADVESLNANQMGVYGLYRGNTPVYVGRGDIRERLLAHLNGDNACITRERPTQWTGEVIPNHVAREKELILELDPVCNRKVG